MLAYRRRKALLDWLSGHGSLTVRQAASRLTVSEVTIRSDFRALERQGIIRRVHGGAVLAHGDHVQGRDERRPDAHPSFLLAQRAAAMVEDGESVVITAGRVSADLAHALTPRRHLKVVTNSLEVARVLADEPTNTVVIVGGVVRPSGVVTIGSATLDSLTNLKAARAFVASSHLSGAFGLMEESPDKAATLQALVALAESIVVVLDSSGSAGQALVSVAPLSAIEHVVLDEHASEHFIDELRGAGVTVSLCGSAVVTVPPLNNNQGTFKIGFANLSETEVFTAEVRRSIEEAAKSAGNIELLLADNNYDGETALRNAEQFIAQAVDLVIEYQTDDSYAYRLMHR